MGRVRGKEERGRANYDLLISDSYKSSKLNADLFKFTKQETKDKFKIVYYKKQNTYLQFFN